MESIYHEDYEGPRFTYGLTHRPLMYAAQPQDFIIGSWRAAIGFRHGVVDYPRALTMDEQRGYELTLVHSTEPSKAQSDRILAITDELEGSRFSIMGGLGEGGITMEAEAALTEAKRDIENIIAKLALFGRP